LKDYYLILEVTPMASAIEIKRSYRRLAQLYHPDRNSSAHAEALFKEINAAYEVLGDPAKRWAYDNRAVVSLPASRDPAIRRRPPGYRPRRSGPSEVFLAKQAALPFMRTAFLAGIFISLLLLIDFALPENRSRDRIRSSRFDMKYARGRIERNTLVTESGKKLQIGGTEMIYFPPNSEVEIRSSSIFRVFITVQHQETKYEAGNLATVYRNFSFAPIVLLVVSVLGLVYRRQVEFVFNLGIVGIFMILLTLFFLYLSIV
jgi:curved DNA-binding protein CbpA